MYYITYKYKIYNPTLLQCYITHLYTKHDINKSKDIKVFYLKKKTRILKLKEANGKVLKRKSENFINPWPKIDLGGKVLDFC